MVKEQRVNLLGHPLCMALVRHKWQSFGRLFYFINLSLFLLFIIFLTEFMISSVVPYSADRIIKECENQGLNGNMNISTDPANITAVYVFSVFSKYSCVF